MPGEDMPPNMIPHAPVLHHAAASADLALLELVTIRSRCLTWPCLLLLTWDAVRQRPRCQRIATVGEEGDGSRHWEGGVGGGWLARAYRALVKKLREDGMKKGGGHSEPCLMLATLPNLCFASLRGMMTSYLDWI